MTSKIPQRASLTCEEESVLHASVPSGALITVRADPKNGELDLEA
jgi:hypothetical protein